MWPQCEICWVGSHHVVTFVNKINQSYASGYFFLLFYNIINSLFTKKTSVFAEIMNFKTKFVAKWNRFCIKIYKSFSEILLSSLNILSSKA